MRRGGQQGGAAVLAGQRQSCTLLVGEGERVRQTARGGRVGSAQTAFQVEQAPRTHAGARGQRLLRQVDDFPIASDKIPNRLVRSGRQPVHVLSCYVYRCMTQPV